MYRDGDRYEGEWRNDERHGKGSMVYASAVDRDGSRKVEEKYEGDWVDGKMSGRGVYHYADGSIYDGQWQEGKMHGTGVFLYPNGNRYEGEFSVSEVLLLAASVHLVLPLLVSFLHILLCLQIISLCFSLC